MNAAASTGKVLSDSRQDLRRFQQLIVEFPSGPLRSSLETLNGRWQKLLGNLESDPDQAAQAEGYRYRYAESLLPLLENSLRQAQPADPELQESVDELIEVFGDADDEMGHSAQERLEAGLELLTPPKP